MSYINLVLLLAMFVLMTLQWVLLQKKSKQVGLRIYFFENPLEFFFFLPLESPNKTKLNPWIFFKIVLASQIPWKFQGQKQRRPLEIPHFFLGQSWKFYFLFNQPLENPHAISLIHSCSWKFIFSTPPGLFGQGSPYFLE